jgi:hypothetical protein
MTRVDIFLLMLILTEVGNMMKFYTRIAENSSPENFRSISEGEKFSAGKFFVRVMILR